MTPGTSRAQPVSAGVNRVLALAATWLAWDGRPCFADTGDRLYTPNKALRRYVDHLVDHLAQIEALVAGAAPEADHWHGSGVTLDSDWGRFSEADLNEARQRLRRLGQLYELRLNALSEVEWTRDRDPEWSIQAIVEHVADPWYAEQVGDLSPRRQVG